MEDVFDELEELFGGCNMNDEMVKKNHKFIEKLNKKMHHKIKKPLESGTKAS